MTVMTKDDLLGRPTGPMIPPDEAAASGRVSLTLVPDGTFVTYRRDPSRMGALFAGPNAYNTGRVKVLTPDHAERDFPAEGGTAWDAQLEPKMSYRTRAEAYKFRPYGDAKPVIGKPMWPAKQLFPLTPTVKRVDSVEHDIVPVSSRTSKRDSLVAPVDGDDSRRGFSPVEEMKGDMAMYGLADETALTYGHSDPDSARGVDQEDILTLVAFDDQDADWQLSGVKKAARDTMIAQIASKCATRLGQAAIKRASAGAFKSVGAANDWIKSNLLKVHTRKAEKLRVALIHAGDVVIKGIAAQLQAAVEAGKGAKPMSDYLSSFNWNQKLRRFGWRRFKPGLRGMGDDTQYPEYADGGDTTGWNSFSDNDDFNNLGASADEDWKKGLVTSLESQATATVANAVKTGEISTAEQIAKAVETAAQVAAQVYAAKVGAAKPASTSVLSKVGATILPPDQPFYKQPLFWGGLGLLAIGGIFMATKGGKSGGSRRRSTTRRYRRNFPVNFNRSRRWKSRWA